MTTTQRAGGPAESRDIRWIVGALALLGLVGGLLLSSIRTPVYEAEAIVSVSNPIGTLEDEVAIATGPTVLEAAEATLTFRPDVSVTAADVASLLSFTARSDQAERAADAANVVAGTYTQVQTNVAASIVDFAEVPSSTTGTSRLVFTIAGMLLGTIVGLAAMVFLRRPRSQRSEPQDDEVAQRVAARRARRAGGSEAEPTAAPPEAPAAIPLTPTPPTSAHPTPATPPSFGPDPEPFSTSESFPAEDPFPTEQPSPMAEPAYVDVREPQPAPVAQAQPAAVGFADQAHETPAEPAALMTQTTRPATLAAAAVPAAIWSDASESFTGFSDGPQAAFDDPEVVYDDEPEMLVDEPELLHDRDAIDIEALEATAVLHTYEPEVLPETDASTFAVAAAEETPAEELPARDAGLVGLTALDRRALKAQYETAQYEFKLAHDGEVAHLVAEHERVVSELRNEIGGLNKELRLQGVRLQNRSGNNQTRVGDLEAQVDALEVELAGIRQLLETERIAHTKRITEERGTADRALDNARREYREEIAKHLHTHRATIADHQADLDTLLAEDRSKHALELENAHASYERALDAERARAEAQVEAATDRHQREMSALIDTTKQELDQQAAQHKDTIASLRNVTETNDAQLRELEKSNRALRSELSTQQKHARHHDTENRTTIQRLNDEISVQKGELDGERERNAALRADVLRRSAEAHGVIDQAVEERTAQLAELETSMARQRDYADRRVREISASAEEQARQATMREASLTATISRLNREIEELKGAQQPAK